MRFFKIISIITIFVGLYGILNLFIGKKRPIHLYRKKDIKINYKYYKYYKYYYLFSYIIFTTTGFIYWEYIPNTQTILSSNYFFPTIIFLIMQSIGVLFIDSKYTSK